MFDDELTVKSDDGDDETNRKNKDNERINLEAWRFVGVESCLNELARLSYDLSLSRIRRVGRHWIFVNASLLLFQHPRFGARPECHFTLSNGAHPSLASTLKNKKERGPHTQHGAAATTCTGSASAARSSIGDLVCSVCCSLSSDGSRGSARGLWR